MKNYKLGFSLKGFTAFMLIMIPNVIWMIKPPVYNPIAGNSIPYPIFDLVANVSQTIMIALLIILIPKKTGKGKAIKINFSLASFCLVGYFIAWISYYNGISFPWLYVSMAVLPSVFFISIDLWLNNYIAVVPSIVFGITHVAFTCHNFLG